MNVDSLSTADLHKIGKYLKDKKDDVSALALFGVQTILFHREGQTHLHGPEWMTNMRPRKREVPEDALL